MNNKKWVLIFFISFLGLQCHNSSKKNTSEKLSAATLPLEKQSILLLGASEVTGEPLLPTATFTYLLQRHADSLQLNWEFINGGISGELPSSTIDRLNRLDLTDFNAILLCLSPLNNTSLSETDINHLETVIQQKRDELPGKSFVSIHFATPSIPPRDPLAPIVQESITIPLLEKHIHERTINAIGHASISRDLLEQLLVLANGSLVF